MLSFFKVAMGKDRGAGVVMVPLLLLLLGSCHLLSAQLHIPINHPALYPEGFAWDDYSGRFITGSIGHGCLFTVSDGGVVQEFIKDDAYAGKAAIVGVDLDRPRRRVLVVVRNALNAPSAFDALASYHLQTKERIFLSRLDREGMKSGPNDVAVDPSGNAYVTDSVANFVWKVTPEGVASVFAESPLFSPHPIIAIDPPAVVCGLNGIVVVGGQFLLVVQTNSGKLFKVGLEDANVQVVDMKSPLTAADGLALRKDGTLVVVSTDFVWKVKGQNGWESAEIIDEVPLDRSLNATTAALRGDDRTFIIHSHFQDTWTYYFEGPEALPGGLRKDFSVQEIYFPNDSDNNPLWLLLIPVMFLVLAAGWKFQMSQFFKQYRRKRD
eukprot:c24447_g1_i1 orf=359-1501(+)